MNLHTQVEKLLPGYALGAVDMEELALVQSHLPGCKKCIAALGQHLEVAAALALAGGAVAPPAGLRDRILEAATGADRIVALSGVPRRTRLERLMTAPRMFGFAAVAAAILVVGIVGWNLSLEQRLSTASSELTANQVARGEITSTAGMSVGTVTYLSRDRFGMVSFHGLTPPAGKVFELWIIDASGHADPIGTFLPETDGNKLILVPRVISPSDQIVVTEEPPGGSRIPSAPVFAGRI